MGKKNKSKTMNKKTYGTPCTHGKRALHLITVNKCNIVCGGAEDIADADAHGIDFDMRISMGGGTMFNRSKPTKKLASVSFNNTPEGMFEGFKQVDEEIRERQSRKTNGIVIDWPDFGTPGFTREWWDALADDLKNFDGTVAIFCQAGHGRTGTSIAILSKLLGVVPKKEDPIQWVRDNYCERTVETESQVAYVESILDYKSKAGSSHKTSSGTSYVNLYHPASSDDEDIDVLIDNMDEDEPMETGICDLCAKREGKFDELQNCLLCDDCFEWSEKWAS